MVEEFFSRFVGGTQGPECCVHEKISNLLRLKKKENLACQQAGLELHPAPPKPGGKKKTRAATFWSAAAWRRFSVRCVDPRKSKATAEARCRAEGPRHGGQAGATLKPKAEPISMFDSRASDMTTESVMRKSLN